MRLIIRITAIFLLKTKITSFTWNSMMMTDRALFYFCICSKIEYQQRKWVTF